MQLAYYYLEQMINPIFPELLSFRTLTSQ